MSEELMLWVKLEPMPRIWCEDPEALHVALESKSGSPIPGRVQNGGMVWEMSVRVQDVHGSPDFLGDVVHGRRGERHLYVAWAQAQPSGPPQRFRRLKVYLTPVTRSTWSSEGIGWEMMESQGVCHTHISGQGPDGTPHCGTAPAHWAPGVLQA